MIVKRYNPYAIRPSKWPGTVASGECPVCGSRLFMTGSRDGKPALRCFGVVVHAGKNPEHCDYVRMLIPIWP